MIIAAVTSWDARSSTTRWQAKAWFYDKLDVVFAKMFVVKSRMEKCAGKRKNKVPGVQRVATRHAGKEKINK